MKRLTKIGISALLALAAASCGNASKQVTNDSIKESQTPKPNLQESFTVPASAFDPDGSHIQGIAASEDALYLSQAPFLVKTDWTGKALLSRTVVNHTGDLCYYNGELYGAVAVMEGNDNNTPGVGIIQVYDKNLHLVREQKVDRRIDGITCMDGILYVGMGSKTIPSSTAHRENILARYDCKTLKEIAPRADFDYGYETRYGFQNITNDGKYIYASFYAVSGAPEVAIFDKDLKIVGTYKKAAYNGLDYMPQSLTSGKFVFVMAKTTINKDPKGVTCTISWWTPEDKQ